MTAPASTNGHATDPQSAAEAATLRRLMMRRGEAAERHRIVARRMLGLDRTESAAIALLSTTRALTPGALADRLLLSSATVSALTARLEDRGAVERRGHPRDRRSVVVSASAKQLELTPAIYAPLIADLDRLIGQLSPITRSETQHFLPQATALLHRRSDALIAYSAHVEKLAATPLTPGPWA